MFVCIVPPQSGDRCDANDEVFTMPQGAEEVVEVIVMKHLESSMNATVCWHQLHDRELEGGEQFHPVFERGGDLRSPRQDICMRKTRCNWKGRGDRRSPSLEHFCFDSGFDREEKEISGAWAF